MSIMNTKVYNNFVMDDFVKTHIPEELFELVTGRVNMFLGEDVSEIHPLKSTDRHTAIAEIIAFLGFLCMIGGNSTDPLLGIIQSVKESLSDMYKKEFPQ